MSRGLLALVVSLGLLACGCGAEGVAPKAGLTVAPTHAKPSSSPSPTVSASPLGYPFGTLTAGSAVACAHGTPLQPDGRALRQVARFDATTVTLTGRPVQDQPGWADMVLQVQTHAGGQGRVRLTIPPRFAGFLPPTLQVEPVDPAGFAALCVARVEGGRVFAFVGVRLGNNCCSGLVAVPVTPEGAGGQRWFAFDGNGVQLVTLGGRARLVSSVWMGCTDYWSCADGGDSVIVDDFDGTRTDVTKDFPQLLRADAAYWRSDISATHPAQSSGSIAAWIADECRLGHAADAWRWLDDQLKAGRLNGDGYHPGGKPLVAFLHLMLREEGFCAG